jgi:xanthine dehydrogenase accessory factor
VKDIYSTILDSFKTGRPSVLAMVVSLRGSSPRGVGSKMLIMENGAIFNSVGGGVLEKGVIDASSRVFSSQLPLLFRSDSETSCGGDVEVLLEPLSPDDKISLAVLRGVVDITRRGGSALLATVLDVRLWGGGHAPRALFKSSGEIVGLLPNMEETGKIIVDSREAFLGRGRPEILTCNDGAGKAFRLFVEPIVSAPVLYIFGGGHVSSEVVPLCCRVGFKSVVIDDRAEFSDPVNFPGADKVFHYSYDGVINNLYVDKSTCIVIMTRSHSCDQTVLNQALRTDARYIGMIGSRRKITTIFENLLKEGFTNEDLARVHSPIGLDIGAETPQEIALSIVAELVKVRAEG